MNPEMKQDKLDSILADEQELVPSSGFLARVMEQVQEEAAAPAPIPFPWKRAIPGIVLAAGVLGWGAVETVRYALHARFDLALPRFHFAAGSTTSVEQAAYVVGALAVSAAAWMLARRLAGRSGLL